MALYEYYHVLTEEKKKIFFLQQKTMAKSIFLNGLGGAGEGGELQRGTEAAHLSCQGAPQELKDTAPRYCIVLRVGR